jgi:hypothetical protein
MVLSRRLWMAWQQIFLERRRLLYWKRAARPPMKPPCSVVSEKGPLIFPLRMWIRILVAYVRTAMCCDRGFFTRGWWCAPLWRKDVAGEAGSVAQMER